MKVDDVWSKVVLVILFGVSLTCHFFISGVQERPYMDEIFHVPQTQEYCKGNFWKWDNKITTLPGLYIIPAVIAILFQSKLECTTFLLRSLNVVITMCIYWVFYRMLPEGMLKKKRAFMALTLTIFPVSYFFSFLYYTDQLSTLLVLLMIHLSSRNYVALSAMAGAYAVFTRQTNIVWVLWVAIMNSWEVLGEDLPKWIKIMLSKTPQPRSQKQKFKRKETMSGKSLIQANLVFASKCVVKMAPKVMPYTIIILGFLAFVIFNGGLVVGDRLAHEASLNLPQLFYFAFFVGFMLFPLMILYGTGKTLNQISKHRSVFLALIVASLVIVHFNTVVHPYLLADNRHYTFYVWKRLYEWYPISRYLLVPCYIVVWFWIWTYVRWDSVSFLAFFICLAVSIIPQKLMEYRYFILPYYVLRLNIKYSDWTHLGLECLLYVLVNAFTIYQFTMNPIVVHSQSTISRFMW